MFFWNVSQYNISQELFFKDLLSFFIKGHLLYTDRLPTPLSLYNECGPPFIDQCSTMDHAWIAHIDDFEPILDLLTDQVLLRIVHDLQSKSNDSWHETACKRVKEYVNKNRQRILTAALNKGSRTYIRGSPCYRCRFNEPCLMCKTVTPFDITAKHQKFKFTLCRGNEKHVCIKCFISNSI